MNLNLSNIKSLKKNTDSELEKYVYDYIIDHWHDYDDKKAIFTDVLNYGCQSGIVGSLCYYSDTTKFYKDHKEEINDLLYTAMCDCGIYDTKDLFGKRWDEEDPLAHYDINQNLLAWFGFEETLRSIGRQFEELEEYI